MNALIEIAIYVTQSLLTLFLWAVLVRFLLQLVRADFYNPISQFFVRVTNPVLRPLRRIIPGWGGLDVAALVLAVLVEFMAVALVLILSGYGLPAPLDLVIWASLGVASLIVNFYWLMLLISIALSWIAPGSYHPAAVLVQQLVEPLLAPARRLLPAMGGIDFSPIFLFMAINVVQIVLRNLAVAAELPRGLVLGL